MNHSDTEIAEERVTCAPAPNLSAEAVRTALPRRTFLGALASAAGFTKAICAQAGDAAPVLKAAVIGHTGRGDYGHGWEGIFTDRPGIRVVAVADPDPAGRAKTAAKIGAQRSYGDYRELLAAEQPQLVSLAMRHADQHFTIARDVLRAGAHLYCEKPFTTTAAEADELLAEAGRRGLRIAVAHTLRLLPAIVRLKQAVTEGLLGTLVELRTYGKQDARAGGEDMMVLGSHLFDLLRLLAGDPLWCTARVLSGGRDITRADARLVKDNVGLVAGNEVFAQFAFGQGVQATFTSSARLRETIGSWGIEVLGSGGAGRIVCDIPPHVFLRRSGVWKTEGRVDAWEGFDPRVLKAPPGEVLDPVSDWLAAIRESREPVCSGRNGAWAVEMAMGVYQGALTHQRVAFPLKARAHPLAADRARS